MRRVLLTLLAVVGVALTAVPAASAAETERARIIWNRADDLDLYIYDAAGNVAFFDDQEAIPDGSLSPDITDSGGPEVFTDARDPSTREFGFRVCYFVGDDTHADELGVRGDVRGCGRGIASGVQLGIHEPFGKAAEDADE